jgi:DNA-binding response OmpR family regulator
VSELGAVLLAEDDDDIREALAELLRDEGFEVRTAAHGGAALAALQHWRPNVILLDLQMPEVDGRAFRLAQRANPALMHIPVIVLSAVGQLNSRVADLDAFAVFAKPCDVDALIAAIKRLV